MVPIVFADLLSGADSLLKCVLAVQPLYGAAWLTWAKMNDQLYSLLKEASPRSPSPPHQQQPQQGPVGTEAERDQEEDPLLQYLVSAIVGYLMNMQLR